MPEGEEEQEAGRQEEGSSLRAEAAAALCALALAFGACGDGEETSVSSPGQPSAAQDEAQQGSGEKREVPVPASKADAVALSAIDESIENYGHIASSQEAEEILAALRAFMDARAEGNYAKACALLIAYARGPVERCPKALRIALKPISPKLLRQASEIDVAAIKVEGPEAFVVYSSPGVRSQIIYVKEEGGRWKVGKVSADRLL